ncbi:hypothetical protein [Nocardia sp. CNY236]|uniref:hypothetical protein n=1 Tax=Nocardia sp. CNY236 TaxID=1169152 RepID=UPI001E3CF232|nr:hypothetical protein [Nocardia sp. CNY236]
MPVVQPLDESSDLVWIDYAQFGERFVAHAVTAARIESAIAGMADHSVTVGPVSLGPVGRAGVLAQGSVGKPRVFRIGPHVTFEVTVPVSLTLKVLLGGKKLRLEARVEIDLTLHARTADPLLIVIDIPRIQRRDISFVLRAQAVESAWEWLLDPIAGVMQREVASRVNAMLAEPKTRRALVFDVEALIDDTRSAHRDNAQFDWIGYGEFGRRFFARIVTRSRVYQAVAGLEGRSIEVGPLRTGPRSSAVVTVRGAVLTPRLADRAAPTVTFDLTLPVILDITVDVMKANHYRAHIEVPLALVARAAEPLLVVIDVPPPDPADIRMEFTAHGVRAAVLGALARIKKQVPEQVAAVVRQELADASMRTIDVAARIDGAA